MQIRYINDQGQHVAVPLGTEPIMIGSGQEADIRLSDGPVSPLHCSVRLWDGDYCVKNQDPETKTYVNGQIVEVAKLELGDKITVGNHNLFVERQTKKSPGANTLIRKIGKEMHSERKNYSSMLSELVQEAEKKPKP